MTTDFTKITALIAEGEAADTSTLNEVEAQIFEYIKAHVPCKEETSSFDYEDEEPEDDEEEFDEDKLIEVAKLLASKWEECELAIDDFFDTDDMKSFYLGEIFSCDSFTVHSFDSWVDDCVLPDLSYYCDQYELKKFGEESGLDAIEAEIFAERFMGGEYNEYFEDFLGDLLFEEIKNY